MAVNLTTLGRSASSLGEERVTISSIQTRLLIAIDSFQTGE